MITIDWVKSTESTAKFLEAKQASTTIPFGWEGGEQIKTICSIVVNSYNAVSTEQFLSPSPNCDLVNKLQVVNNTFLLNFQGGSANTRKAYIPHTVPIITTNNDCDDIK